MNLRTRLLLLSLISYLLIMSPGGFAVDWESESFYRYDRYEVEQTSVIPNGSIIAKIEYGALDAFQSNTFSSNVLKCLTVWGTNDPLQNKEIVNQKLNELYLNPIVSEIITLQRYNVETKEWSNIEALVGTEYSGYGGPLSPHKKHPKRIGDKALDISHINPNAFYIYHDYEGERKEGPIFDGLDRQYILRAKIAYGDETYQGRYEVSFEEVEETIHSPKSVAYGLDEPFALNEAIENQLRAIYYRGDSEILAISYVVNGQLGAWIPIYESEYSSYSGPISDHSKINNAKYSDVYKNQRDTPNYEDYVARLRDFQLLEDSVVEVPLTTEITNADFVEQMVKLANRISVIDKIKTSDFSIFTNTHNRYAIEAAKLGLVNGGYFDSDKLITREEYANTLLKILQMDNAPIKIDGLDKIHFKDEKDIAPNYLSSMRIAYLNQILDTGLSKVVRPKEIVNREMSLKMRLNLLESDTFLVMDKRFRNMTFDNKELSDSSVAKVTNLYNMGVSDPSNFVNCYNEVSVSKFASLLMDLYKELGGKNIPTLSADDYNEFENIRDDKVIQAYKLGLLKYKNLGRYYYEDIEELEDKKTRSLLRFEVYFMIHNVLEKSNVRMSSSKSSDLPFELNNIYKDFHEIILDLNSVGLLIDDEKIGLNEKVTIEQALVMIYDAMQLK